MQDDVLIEPCARQQFQVTVHDDDAALDVAGHACRPIDDAEAVADATVDDRVAVHHPDRARGITGRDVHRPVDAKLQIALA